MNLLLETSMLQLIMQKKADLKNATGTDTYKLAAKSNLVSLKAEIKLV